MRASTKVYELETVQLASEAFRLDILQDLVREGKIDTLTMLRLELAVQEAVTNGVEHGNLELQSVWKEEIREDGLDRFSIEKAARLKDRSYAEKRVRVLVNVDDIKIAISVQDQGSGFTPQSYMSSSALNSYGRGLAMIRANVDEVSFDFEGRLIQMIKRF